MCILCPIKVLLRTSHVFNRFMFSICEASSHLQSRLLHVLFVSHWSVSSPWLQKQLSHFQQTSMHFIDVPSSYHHLVHLWIRWGKGLEKLIPGRIVRLRRRIHFLLHPTSNPATASEFSPKAAFYFCNCCRHVITCGHSVCEHPGVQQFVKTQQGTTHVVVIGRSLFC